MKELHRETAAKLGVDAATCEEVEGLLTQLQQLLVGISIMQVGGCGGEGRGSLTRGWWRSALGAIAGDASLSNAASYSLLHCFCRRRRCCRT